MRKIDVRQLKPYLYSLTDTEASAFLVIGDEKACLIDTMNGASELDKIVKGLTDKEVIVVNTHGHPDHIYGNMYFEKAFISRKDLKLTEEFLNDPAFIEECRAENRKPAEFGFLSEGDMIRLGGKTLAVYELGGHTEGGLLLLLEEDRILFTGDAINHHLWMQLPHSLPLGAFRDNLSQKLFLEEKADYILHGHAVDFDDISLMRCVYNGVCEILEGKTDEDTDYHWFGGIGIQHPFAIDYEMRYGQAEHVICYSK